VSATIAAALLAISATAYADCEADMAQLDQVLKSPGLSANGKAGLLEAKKKAVAAVKTDDDATCNKVIMAAIKQAGVAPVAPLATTPVVTGKAAPALGDMTPFRTLASTTLRLVKLGDMPNAKASIKELEAAWDQAEPRLRPRNADAWKTVDQAIDRALSELRASKPSAASGTQALNDLLTVLDSTK
jgi:ATP/maltotriose-dependent transcriptional regulator MalT